MYRLILRGEFDILITTSSFILFRAANPILWFRSLLYLPFYTLRSPIPRYHHTVERKDPRNPSTRIQFIRLRVIPRYSSFTIYIYM